MCTITFLDTALNLRYKGDRVLWLEYICTVGYTKVIVFHRRQNGEKYIKILYFCHKSFLHLDILDIHWTMY